MSIQNMTRVLPQLQGNWSNTTQYTLSEPLLIQNSIYYINPIVISGVNNNMYMLDGTQLPPVGTDPSVSGNGWIPFAQETATEILSTLLTGLSITSGTPSANSTILESIGYLTYKSYLLLTGYAVASVADGALSLASVTATSKSSDVTVGATTIALPLNKTFANGQIKLNVTTASASGSTFTVTGTNCTVVSESIVVGESVTALDILINYTVVTTSTANPTISITASGTTGTVSYSNSSVRLS